MISTLMTVWTLALAGSAGIQAGESEVPDEATGSSVTRALAEPSAAREALDTLGVLQEGVEAKRKELVQAQGALAAAQALPESERVELARRVAALQLELDEVEADYESIATGIDITEYNLAAPTGFDLQAELQKLVQPIVEELKSATEAPRQIERMRSELAQLEAREGVAKDAFANVEALLAELDPDDPMGLRPGLDELRNEWGAKIKTIRDQKTVSRFQLDKRLSERTSILESTQSAFGNFFRTRGLNLLLAVGAFFGVLLGMRAIYRRVAHGGRSQGQTRRFYARLIDVLYFLFVGLIALGVALIVLYAAGDWVLLGLTLMFLLGVAWASKTAVPMFLEQIRLLLNLGTVREQEHVVLDGVPYRVAKLSFYTIFSNAALAGGVRRLPLMDLMSMRSRVCSKDEVWFPCRRGDWVRLSDERRGKVIHQSPESVQLQLLGGSVVTYQTQDFLGLAPQNLSDGFRLTVTFGIDYAHQAISTTRVPEVFASRVRAGVEALLGADALVACRVEFGSAGSSSLDYVILLDLTGEAAPSYDKLPRLVQRLCVETCNDEGWGIPFAQVTVHQAAGLSAAGGAAEQI